MNIRRRYLRFWRDIPAEVDDELQFHLESLIQQYCAQGMSPDEAREAALHRFGDVQQVRERCETIDKQYDRDRRLSEMLESIAQDLRYAWRALRRSPGFAAIAAFTLALGIGANTAIFSVVNGVLLRPLPYHEPDQLVRLYTSFRGSGDLRYSMSQPEFMDYKSLGHVFENAAAFSGLSMTITGDGDPQRVRGIAATRDFLPVLGITPMLGRNFQDDEGRAGTERVVMLSHDFWRSRFGGDSSVLNRVIRLNGLDRRVVGVLPPGQTFEQAEAFIPVYINPDSMTGRSSNYLSGIARLKRGVKLEDAQRELDALTRRSNEIYPNAYPKSMGYGASVFGMHGELVGDIRPALLILLAAVALVLLIACANVANLLLARGEARQREIAVRIALGAGRARIVRQLLTESAMLATIGAAGGVLLAWWGLRSIIALSPESIPRVEEIGLDATVGLVTLGVTALTGILFGLAPAMQLTRPDLQSTLKEGTRGGSEGTQRQVLGRSLVVAEIALAVVVVIGATLLVRSFNELRSVDPGFDSDHLLAVDLSIPAARYDAAATTQYYRSLLESMRRLPGVQSAAAASDIPPVASQNNWDVSVDGRARTPDQQLPSPNVRFVTQDYVKTIGFSVSRGRDFGVEDHATSMPAGLINEAAASVIWPSDNPVGQRVRFSQKSPWITIVGVVKNARSTGIGEDPIPELFLLNEQLSALGGGAERTMYVLVRTSGDPAALSSAVREVVKASDGLLPSPTIRTMEEIVSRSIARQRFTTTLLTAFGLVALTLAAVGIYGIMTYGVKRRTREIGIRMALGAQQSDVVRLIVGQGMRLAAIGLSTGMLAAFLISGYMERLLFGIRPTDPASYATIAVLLTLVALAATWIPARRAVRTDPGAALRVEG